MKKENVLVIGANGQIGSDLIVELSKRKYNVIALDKVTDKIEDANRLYGLSIPIFTLDFEDKNKDIKQEIINIIDSNNINHIYHLIAKVSGAAADDTIGAWNLNVGSLLTILEIATEKLKKEDNEEKKLKIFWPSSMAAFGKNPESKTTEDNLDQRYPIAYQFDPCLPETIYGATKVTGEALCAYYSIIEKIDIRSIRYPGLISFNTLGGGGTTDYAIHIYFYKVRDGKYLYCFIKEDIEMEMMYMPDAINATIMLMEADKSKIKKGISYNLAGINFTPIEIAQSIMRVHPDSNFELECFDDDARNKYALSWPAKIDGSLAKSWGWDESQIKYDLDEMTKDMIKNLNPKKLDEWEKEQDDLAEKKGKPKRTEIERHKVNLNKSLDSN